MTAKSCRRAVLALLVLAGLVACSNTEMLQIPGDGSDWTELTGKVPIAFSTTLSVSDPATKTTTPLSTSSNFRVFAFYQPGVVDDDPAVDYTGTWNDFATYHWTPNFMYDQAVSYSAGAWSYTPVKYWPNNAENTITFWAYSPYYNNSSILRLYAPNTSSAYTNATSGVPDIEFTADGTRDLLISDLVQDRSLRGGDPATVPLVFNHALCWVDFAVKKVDDADACTIVLKGITLENICWTAVHSLQSGWGTGWNRDDRDVYPYNVSGVELDKDEADRITFPTSGQLLLMPQGLRGTTANVVITYTINGGSDITETVSLGSLTTVWEEGKHYTYNVNISPGNIILFTATVAAWNSEQTGYFNVN